MNSKYYKTRSLNWEIVIPELKERTGKDYQIAFIREVIKGTKTSKLLKETLKEMGIV